MVRPYCGRHVTSAPYQSRTTMSAACGTVAAAVTATVGDQAGDQAAWPRPLIDQRDRHPLTKRTRSSHARRPGVVWSASAWPGRRDNQRNAVTVSDPLGGVDDRCTITLW